MQRRKIDLRDLGGVLVEVNRLHTGGYDRAGNWDLSEILSHCGQFMEYSLEGFDFKVPLPPLIGLLKPLLRRIILSRRSTQTGFKNPEPLDPEVHGSEQEMIDGFTPVLRRVQDQTASFHPSPLFGKLTSPQWRDMHVIRCSHPLGFLIPRE